MKSYTETQLRELDAWIAEHVFGWHKIQTGQNHSLCSVCGNGFGARHNHYYPDFHGSMSGSVPFYSTDPAAAMQVLKRCVEFAKRNLGHSVILTDTMNGYCVGLTIPSFKFITADTWELAIALFAKALFRK
jgi:hypothetical protein